MQKYAEYNNAVLFAKYAEVYILHILHLHALPTLLMLRAWGVSELQSHWRRLTGPDPSRPQLPVRLCNSS